MRTYNVDYKDLPVHYFHREDDVITFLQEETDLSDIHIDLINLDLQEMKSGDTLRYDDLFITLQEEEE